jgi:hypothetical protein
MSLHGLITRLGMKSLGGQAYQGYAPSPTADVRPEHAKMRISGTCTTGNVDRSREIVVPSGVEWSEYRNNPIFTLCHGWRDPDKIVGRCEVDGRFAVRPSAGGNGWDFTAQLFKEGKNAHIAYETLGMVDTGILRGVSLGFRFLTPDAEDVIARDGHPALRINRCYPFEITLVPTPDNPDAIVRVVEKGFGGRRLSAAWLSILKPMVPAVRSVGFTTKKREKAMPLNTQTPAPGGVAQTGQQPDPNDPNAQQDPNAQPQQPAMPTQKPSVALMLAAESYCMGFIRFLSEQQKVQENPQMKALLPSLVLHLSQMYRTLSTAHQQIQMEDNTFPNLMGHGGMISPDPTPDGQPGFGDGMDDATGPEITAGAAIPSSPDQPIDDPMAGGGDDPNALSDEDMDSLGGDDAAIPGDDGAGDLFGGAGDADADGVQDDQDVDADPMAPPPDDADAEPVEDDEPADDEDDAPKKKKKPPFEKREKAFAVRDVMVQLIREKGFTVAQQRADKLLAAFDANMKREFSQTDVNWLRWGAANVTSASKDQLASLGVWMRQKAMEGVTRPVVAPPLSPEEQLAEAVKTRVNELLAAQSA